MSQTAFDPNHFDVPLIDREVLRRQTLDDPALAREVLALFKDVSRSGACRIGGATAIEDLAFHLHALKGAAAGVGAARVEQTCRALGEGAREGRGATQEEIAALRAAVEATNALIGDMLEAETAP